MNFALSPAKLLLKKLDKGEISFSNAFSLQMILKMLLVMEFVII